MGNIGLPEIMVVLVVALIVLGPNRLPGAARQLGRALQEFRRVTNDFQSEVRDAFTDPVAYPPPPTPTPTDAADAAGTPPPGAPTPVLEPLDSPELPSRPEDAELPPRPERPTEG